MPLRNGRITPQEKLWVGQYAKTGDPVYAAQKAGYKAIERNGYKNAASPALVAEAHKKSLALLRSTILPLAIERHMALLADPKVTGQSLNKAIEMAYKYGGVAADPDGQVKEAADMSPQELGAAIAALQRAKAEAQRPQLELEAEEVSKPEPSNVFE
jgi:hypothetical protein